MRSILILSMEAFSFSTIFEHVLILELKTQDQYAKENDDLL